MKTEETDIMFNDSLMDTGATGTFDGSVVVGNANIGNNNILLGDGATSAFDGCVVIGNVAATKHNQLIIGTTEVSVTRDLTEKEFLEVQTIFRTLVDLVGGTK